MAFINLADIMDSITGYDKTFEQFGYKAAGDGTRPWSKRYEHACGNVVEFNAQGWDLFKDGLAFSGHNHNDLKANLLADCSKEQLIEMLTA
jgi:hypothetical protein